MRVLLSLAGCSAFCCMKGSVCRSMLWHAHAVTYFSSENVNIFPNPSSPPRYSIWPVKKTALQEKPGPQTLLSPFFFFFNAFKVLTCRTSTRLAKCPRRRYPVRPAYDYVTSRARVQQSLQTSSEILVMLVGSTVHFLYIHRANYV